MLPYAQTTYQEPAPPPAPLNAVEQDHVVRHLKIVKWTVHRIVERLPAHVDPDDLMHSGILGLIDAVQRFQWGRDREAEEFRAYAECRVRGRVMDELRRLDVLPRSAREKVKFFKRGIEQLRQELKREPTELELSVQLGVDIETCHKLRAEANLGQQIPFDGLQSGDSLQGFLQQILAISDPDTPEALVHIEEVKRILTEEIDKLTERERQVISLYYYEEMTLKEIGMVLSVSESRISQVRSQSIMKLMKRLRAVFGSDAEHEVTEL